MPVTTSSSMDFHVVCPVTTLMEIVVGAEQDLMEPKVLSILYAGGFMLAPLLETIGLLSYNLHFLQAFLFDCNTNMNDEDSRRLYSVIKGEVIIIKREYRAYKQRLLYLEDYWGRNAAVHHFEGTHDDLKGIEITSAALEDEEQKITNWDTYQNALKTENEVIVGLDYDIERIVNRLCYSYFMGSVLTILKSSNIDKFRKLVYPCLKLLRVLDLSFVKWSRGIPSDITDLVHLRYLSLSTIGSLYKLQFFKLKNLQTLIVTSWMERCPLQLPCDILDLPELRHLHVDKRCSQYLPCLVKKNLQTLYWLKVASSDEKPNFRMVPNLKELGIYIEGQLEPSYLGNLVHLHLLGKLKFDVGRVERFYLPIGFPPNLKKLTLRYTYLPWKEMDTIGKLSHLKVLKLKDFAFCGSKWEPSKHSFRKLKALLISRSNLKHWNASSNHFPVLERLVLRYCWELKQVPINFAKIATLNLIVLECCYSSLVTSAMQISSAKSRKIEGNADCLLRVRTVGIKQNRESSSLVRHPTLSLSIETGCFFLSSAPETRSFVKDSQTRKHTSSVPGTSRGWTSVLGSSFGDSSEASVNQISHRRICVNNGMRSTPMLTGVLFMLTIFVWFSFVLGLKVAALLQKIELLSVNLCFLQACLEECKTKMNDGDTWAKILYEDVQAKVATIYEHYKIKSKLSKVYAEANCWRPYEVKGCQRLHRTLDHMVRNFEEVGEWILEEKKEKCFRAGGTEHHCLGYIPKCFRA
nr:putative late blight resistance protein homolog R1B-17 [Ipomoea batatas]